MMIFITSCCCEIPRLMLNLLCYVSANVIIIHHCGDYNESRENCTANKPYKESVMLCKR